MAYGTWWCKTNMGQNIKEDVLRSALRKQLDVLEEADEENIAFGNVKICLEEMEHDEEIKTCIPFDEGSLQDFRENQAEDTEGEEDGQAEFEAFTEFAEANLMTSKEVLAFAEKRGARVEVVNSAAKITGHNGVQATGRARLCFVARDRLGGCGSTCHPPAKKLDRSFQIPFSHSWPQKIGPPHGLICPIPFFVASVSF